MIRREVTSSSWMAQVQTVVNTSGYMPLMASSSDVQAGLVAVLLQILTECVAVHVMACLGSRAALWVRWPAPEEAC
jgi:hypothetical protein